MPSRTVRILRTLAALAAPLVIALVIAKLAVSREAVRARAAWTTRVGLSPDGRQVLVLPTRMCDQDGSCSFEEKTATVYDVDTGAERDVDLTGDAAGWTADGDLVQVRDGEVTVCDQQDCTSTPVDLGRGDLRLAGSLYES